MLAELENLKDNKVDKKKEFDPAIKHILNMLNGRQPSPAPKGGAQTKDDDEVEQTTQGDDYWMSYYGSSKITQEMIDGWNHARDLGQTTA